MSFECPLSSPKLDLLISEAIRLWLEVEAEENGIRSVETTEIAL